MKMMVIFSTPFTDTHMGYSANTIQQTWQPFVLVTATQNAFQVYGCVGS